LSWGKDKTSGLAKWGHFRQVDIILASPYITAMSKDMPIAVRKPAEFRPITYKAALMPHIAGNLSKCRT